MFWGRRCGFCNLTVQNLCTTGNLQVGGNLSVCGTETISNTTPSTSCTNGALVVSGGVGVGGNLNVCGTETVSSTAPSTSCTNGALVVSGGVGIGGNLNVCGLTTSFVSVTGGAGLTGPIPFASLAAYANAYDTALALVLASGTNSIPLPTAGPLLNVTHPNATDIVPQVSGVYLVTYVVEPTIALGVAGTYALTVNGTPQAGTTYSVLAAQVNFAAIGQALLVLAAGDVNVTLSSLATVTLTGTASLTLEKIA